MSYQVLARKWRPANFSELVGQEHVQRALINALDEDRLHHAYLFTGTRGVGKTTIARIFAKSLNCEKGVTSTPCGECSACAEIAEGRYVDLIEVDAASRTGVDDTRELLENVQYAPTRGRYKVYLIDEVHMFSKSSFNALLKTLEEPPPHVKFLLATTDPQKLPVTILSRCLQFNLKRMTVSHILDQLQHILQAEGIEHELAALQLLAEGADGSMRDGLSLLDQAIAFGGGAVREAEVRDMLGTVSRDSVLAILRALVARDVGQVMNEVEALSQLTPDFESVLADLISLLHHMAMAKSVPQALDSYISARNELLALSEQISAEDLQLFYQIALHGRRDLPLAPDQRSGLEMVLLRMLTFRPAEGAGGAAITGGAQQATASPAHSPVQSPARSAAQSSTQSSTQASAAQQAAPAAAATGVRETAAPHQAAASQQAAPTAPAPAAAAPTAAPPAGGASGDWREMIEALAISGMVKQLAVNCVLDELAGNRVALTLDSAHHSLLTPRAQQRLQQALADYLDRDVHLEIQVGDAPAKVETPAKAAAREQDERQQQAEQSIEQDSFVQAMKETFNAEIVPGSVKPVAESTE